MRLQTIYQIILFIGVSKELDGVDALIKLYRSRGKGVKGLPALHAFMPHAQQFHRSILCPRILL